MNLTSIEQRIKNFGAEKIFAALFLFFGVVICFARPPYQLMDEPNNFARVWQISEGIFISPVATQEEISRTSTDDNEKSFGWKNRSPDAATEKLFTASVPTSLVPDEFIFDVWDDSSTLNFSVDRMKKFLSTPLNVNERELGLIPNTGAYAPPVYLPQAVAAFVGRALNLTAGEIFYLVRLGALIFVTACVFWTMKLLPEVKPLIFLLAMLPMFLFEAASASADAVTFGVCFLGTAWLLSLRKSSEKFSRAEIFTLIFLSMMLAFAKSVYGTILLLYFLIPRERVGSSAKFFLFGGMILLLNIFTSLAWTEISSGATGAQLATSRQYLGANSDVAAQINFMLEQPTKFFDTVINSVVVGSAYYSFGFVGQFGATGDLFMPIIFYVAYLLPLIFFTLHGELQINLRERILMLVAASVTSLSFFVIEYLIWSVVGAEFIRGVQGRYFIPLAPIIFCALSIFPPLRHQNLIALMFGTFSGFATVSTLVDTFY